MLPTTISASQVGAMLGVSPFQTPLALYHQLRGEVGEQDDNEALREGRFFEDAIAKIAAQKFSLEVDHEPVKWQHGILTGHPDRFFTPIVDGQPSKRYGVLEIKHTFAGTPDGYGDPGTDQVPLHYWFQLMVYIHLARQQRLGFSKEAMESQWLDYGHLAVRLSGGVQLYRVNYDPQVIAKIEQEAAAFIRRVHEGNPPDAQDEADMRSRWLAADDKVVECGMEQVAIAKQLKALRASRKDIEKQESELTMLLLGYCRDGSKLVAKHPTTGAPVLIATLGADRQFDAAAFLAEHADVAARYQRLDTTKLGKEQKTLYEQYMRRPTSATEQKRVIRLKEFDL